MDDFNSDSVVSKSVALNDVEKWLDAKKIKDKSRESYKDVITLLTNSIEDGQLVLTEDLKWKQILLFPIKGDGTQKDELTYKSRISVEERQRHLSGVKADEAEGKMLAIIACLTGEAKGMIKSLDSEDYKVAQSIAVFFH